MLTTTNQFERIRGRPLARTRWEVDRLVLDEICLLDLPPDLRDDSISETSFTTRRQINDYESVAIEKKPLEFRERDYFRWGLGRRGYNNKHEW
ncbi:hypothetical protein FQN53_006139 [Emmonsiellopsis sp. PD_33]|nr:hypothetical protein FQN53_006139 [Emmonsiellopsis sp. PD_33]